MSGSPLLNIAPGPRMRGKSDSHHHHRRRSSGNRRGPDVFSDEDDYEDNATVSEAASYEGHTYNSPTPPPPEPKKPREVSFSLPPNHLDSAEENDDVEKELDLFSKAIHISNIDEIDHVGLMRGMHERFQRKQLKWQRYASNYSKWAFSMNFIILLMQIVQMLFHQMVEIFSGDSATTQDQDSGSHFSISRMSMYSSRYASPVAEESNLPAVIFNASTLQALRCVLAAATAVLAGLQMKLKLTEKAEKYRRGAKVYGRLHRLSTYYLMLAENGGKVENVTGLWRDAMKKEGKWIPVVKTFMAT